MSAGFERRMRRRARMSAIARVVFALFGVLSLGGTAALRLARGCNAAEARAPASTSP